MLSEQEIEHKLKEMKRTKEFLKDIHTESVEEYLGYLDRLEAIYKNEYEKTTKEAPFETDWNNMGEEQINSLYDLFCAECDSHDSGIGSSWRTSIKRFA